LTCATLKPDDIEELIGALGDMEIDVQSANGEKSWSCGIKKPERMENETTPQAADCLKKTRENEEPAAGATAQVYEKGVSGDTRHGNAPYTGIGCGSGIPTLELARISGGEVMALDIDQAQMDRFAAKVKGQGDARN
jgi:hypothetical protein